MPWLQTYHFHYKCPSACLRQLILPLTGFFQVGCTLFNVSFCISFICLVYSSWKSYNCIRLYCVMDDDDHHYLWAKACALVGSLLAQSHGRSLASDMDKRLEIQTPIQHSHFFHFQDYSMCVNILNKKIRHFSQYTL